MQNVWQRTLQALDAGEQARHDVMVRATLKLACLAAGRHPGCAAVLSALFDEFVGRVAKDRIGGYRAAADEWDRAVQGAVEHAERLAAQLANWHPPRIVRQPDGTRRLDYVTADCSDVRAAWSRRSDK